VHQVGQDRGNAVIRAGGGASGGAVGVGGFGGLGGYQSGDAAEDTLTGD
jgi:hypothetical protein